MTKHDRNTYDDATSKCRSYDSGDLISLFNKEENDFVASKVLELNPSLRNVDYYYPWIGLHEDASKPNRINNKMIPM